MNVKFYLGKLRYESLNGLHAVELTVSAPSAIISYIKKSGYRNGPVVTPSACWLCRYFLAAFSVALYERT